MCGRFTLALPDFLSLTEFLGIAAPTSEFAEPYRPRYNIAPSDLHWMVRSDGGRPELVQAQWGLIPSWSNEAKGFINARMETLHQKPSFRRSFLEKRCLIPADGFFEWSGKKGAKQPYWFHLEDRRPFLFAGIFAEDEREKPTFSIVTMPARGEVARIHHRMPLILSVESASLWQEANLPPRPDQIAAFKQTISGSAVIGLKALAVSSHVNATRNDDERCIDGLRAT